MRLWWRGRGQARDVLALLAMLLAVFLAGQDTVPIPTLSGVGAPTPVAVFAPLILAISVGLGLSRRISLELVAARRIRLLDAAWIGLLVVIAVCGCVALDFTGTQQLGVIAGRDVAGYVGLTLLGWRIVGSHASAVLSVGYAIAAALLGYGAAGTTQLWAWPVAAPDDTAAIVAAAVFCLAGLATVTWSNALKAVRV